MDLSKLKLTREEKKFKEFQDECYKIFNQISERAKEYDWSVVQMERFINQIAPELLRVKTEKFKLDTKYQYLLINEIS